MKGKILKAERDGKYTYVTKQTKYGTFCGKVKVADEDQDIENDLDGYTFAENKCDIQALKERAKLFEQRALGVQHAYNVLLKSGIQEEDEIMRKLARRVDIAKRDASIAKEQYKTVRDRFKDYVEFYLNRRRKMKEKIK